MKHVRVIKWVARVAGLVVVLLFSLLFVGDMFPLFLFQTDPLHMTALVTMLLGLLLAWRWEAIGAALILGGYAADLVIVNMRMDTLSLDLGPIVTFVPLVGLAFAYVAWRERQMGDAS